MADVILIDPPFPERPWDINWLTLFPPKGLLYIAAFLRNNGIDVEVLDTKKMQFERPSLLRRSIEEICAAVKNKIKRKAPKIVGITSSTLSYLPALRIAKAVKEASPETIVVIGGIHVTHTPEDTLKNEFIDAVARGEGEKTMLELAKGMPFEKIKGISYRANKKTINNPDREILKENEIPVPAYDLVDMRDYSYVVLMCTRGCPHKCSYCEVPYTHGCGIRYRPYEKIEKELELAFSLNPKLEIRLEDEFLGLNMQRAEEILNMIKKKNVMPFRTATRPDGVNDKVLQLLKKANCSNLYIGMESGSDEVLKFNSRGMTVKKILEIAETFKRNEMLFHSGFMLGLPGETMETMKQTLAVAKKCCDATFSTVKKNFDELLDLMPFKLIVENSRAEFNLLAPNPGTPLAKDPEKYNFRILHKNWELYDCNTIVGLPNGLTADDILKFKDHAFSEIKKQMSDYGLPVNWWDIGYKG